jgi:hypothetical protein
MFPAMRDTVSPISILAPDFNPLLDPYGWGAGEETKGFGPLFCRGILRVRAAPSRRPRREWPRTDQPDHERRKP